MLELIHVTYVVDNEHEIYLVFRYEVVTIFIEKTIISEVLFYDNAEEQTL